MYYNIISKILKSDKDAPEWTLLFAAGINELENEGKFVIDEQSFEEIKANFQRRGNEIPFDYEHQSLDGVQAPAAGWIKDLRYTDRGIEALTDWTEKAADYISKQEYKYHSPVFVVRKSDNRVISVHSVALTNVPKTNKIKPILAKLNLNQESTMEKEKEVIEVIPDTIKAALDLANDADTSTIVASIHALKQNEKTMVSKADFDALQKKLVEKDANEAVEKAMIAGKITPAQKEWAEQYARNDLNGFNIFVSKAPVVIPVDPLPAGQKEKVENHNIDEATLNIAKFFGNTEDDFKKYGEVK